MKQNSDEEHKKLRNVAKGEDETFIPTYSNYNLGNDICKPQQEIN